MTEIEALRKEVAELRAEVARLREGIYPTPMPVPRYVGPIIDGTGRPIYPGGPWPVTCGMSENGIG